MSTAEEKNAGAAPAVAAAAKDAKDGVVLSPVVKNADMAPDLQAFALETVQKAFDAAAKERDIAAYIRERFDKEQGPTWNVVVGRMFGADVRR